MKTNKIQPKRLKKKKSHSKTLKEKEISVVFPLYSLKLFLNENN